MRHSFTSALRLDIMTSAVVFTLISLLLKKSSSLLSFHSAQTRCAVSFSSICFLKYQNIAGVIAAACCKTTESSERDIKEGARTKLQERSEGTKRSAVGRPRVFSEAIFPANH